MVDNAPIAARLGVTENWIVSRTGVHERRIAAPGETVVDYASRAAAASLETAGVEPLVVDLVLVATMSHDQLSPNAAALVADRIGATAAGAIDVNAACSGFVSALALAAGQVEVGRARTVVVVGADLMSRITDPDDRRTAALFGDGAGAVVVSAGTGSTAIGPSVLGADGSRGELVAASREEAILRMNGHDTFRHAVDRLSEATVDAAAAARDAPGRDRPVRLPPGQRPDSHARSASGSASRPTASSTASAATATPRRRRSRSRSPTPATRAAWCPAPRCCSRRSAAGSPGPRPWSSGGSGRRRADA